VSSSAGWFFTEQVAAQRSCWAFGTQCPSLSKGAWGPREQARTRMKAQRIGAGTAQILVVASKPAGPAPWAQTAWQQAGRPWHSAQARPRPRRGAAQLQPCPSASHAQQLRREFCQRVLRHFGTNSAGTFEAPRSGRQQAGKRRQPRFLWDQHGLFFSAPGLHKFCTEQTAVQKTLWNPQKKCASHLGIPQHFGANSTRTLKA
jgi:hypothetical protein